MTTKKIKHERIASERKRNTTFKNRLEGLTKKAEELSILCGVEVGFVIHTETENNIVQWPSPEVLRERMDRFLSFSEFDKGKKMVLHDKFLEQQLDKMKKNLTKRQNHNDVIEGRKLMNELVRGKPLNEFDLREITILHKYTAKKMDMMDMNDNDNGNNDNDDENNNQIVPASSANDRETRIEDMKNDAWFSEAMADKTGNIEAIDPCNGDGPN